MNDTTNPVANAGPDQTVNQADLVTFNGTGSTDNVAVDNYTWNFTDGVAQTLYGIGPDYTFINASVYIVTLTILDAAGNTHTDTVTITVNDTTKPMLEDPRNNTLTTGDQATFRIDITDNIDINLTSVMFHYTYGGGEWFEAEVSSLNRTGIIWDIMITLWDNAATIQYYFEANDTSDNQNQSAQSGILDITDDDNPTDVTDNTEGDPTTGDEFTFKVSALDNIQLDEVYVTYTYGGIPVTVLMDGPSGGNYTLPVTIPTDAIREFAEHWGIRSIALFGSVLRDDFDDNSDVDVLISFHPGNDADLFDLIEMKLKLQDLFKRSVDLVEKEALINPYRKKEILKHNRTIYAA